MKRASQYFLVILALMFIAQGASAQQPQKQGRGRMGLTLFAHALMEDGEHPVLKVTSTITHSNLVFLKKDPSYTAAYELYLRVFDKDNEIADTAVLRETVTVDDYTKTRSHKEVSRLSRKFSLEPGDYTVRATIRVKDTHLSFQQQTKVTIPDFLETGVGFSEPRLLAVATNRDSVALIMKRLTDDSTIDGYEKAQPVFAEFDKRPAFSFEVYVEGKHEDSLACDLIYEVVDRTKSQVLYGRKKIKLSGVEDRFLVAFDVDDWDPGEYTFGLKAFLPNPPRASESRSAFSLRFSRAMLTKQFDQTLEILSLIATKQEIADLKDASENDRTKLWAEFWGRRDVSLENETNEALEEHLRRVRYVTINFSTIEPGWRTDRGKVYIRHGEPDQIDIRPDPYFQGEYLIWRYYNRNLTFVFYDRFGLGEYRLSNTSAF